MINEILLKILKLKKSILAKSYISELTVFIIVKIPNLNDESKSKLEIVSNIEIKNKEVINIKIAKKYLLISLILILILFKDNLFE